MVFRVLDSFASTTPNPADLTTSTADDYGFFDDIILVFQTRATSIPNIGTGEGNDRVYTSRVLDTSLTMGAHLGHGEDLFVGGAARDEVYDGSGNDVVSLGGGNDTYYASEGNDVVYGGTGLDTLSFEFQSRNYTFDPVLLNTEGVRVDLALTTAQSFGSFGTDTLSGFEVVRGGGGADTILGSAASEGFSGAGGNDVIAGRGGNDNISGGEGNDTLVGGTGRDNLIGEAGNDTLVGDGDSLFGGEGADVYRPGVGRDDVVLSETTAVRDIVRYLAVGESQNSTATTGPDLVRGFDGGGGATDDKIDLSAIDANTALAGNQSFVFRGTLAAFSMAGGEIRYVADPVGVTPRSLTIFIDTDADVDAEMTIRLFAVSSITGSDFIL